jgi:hypothetical protein
VDLYNTILETYPDLDWQDFVSENDRIILKDDGDGIQYISQWNTDLPLPKGCKIGK